MYKLRISLLVIMLLAQTASNVLFPSTSYAAPSTTIVISQVYAGITNGATQEFVSLYNNSAGDVNVTGWCVTNKASVTFACVPSAINVAIFIRAHSYMTISSDSFSTAQSYQPDIKFVSTNQTSGSIVGGSETISLIDVNSNIIDNMGWTTSLAAGSTLQRIETPPAGSGYLVDTDTATDFSKQLSLQIPNSGVYEVQTIIDVCPNILAAQSTIPSGLVFDQAGNCVVPLPVDVCLNIDGLQLTVPIDFLKDTSGACQQDVCINLEGLQTVIPTGYESILDGELCTLIPLTSDVIQITELLPNPAGSDSGNEYVEFYNPNLHSVDLTGYVLWIGPAFEKSYVVPAHTQLPAGAYIRFSNTDILYTLVNSSSRAKLVAPAGNTVSEAPVYNNPLDSEAWAQINTIWQYTNRPTPAAANKVSVYEDTETIDSVVTLADCPAGKYRNALTNRCRNIEADVSVLATCDVDEYRSPDTNRCRKVVVLASQVTACKDGQYRSEETNRCRNIVSTTTELTPCAENQERNAETNRCRNVVKSVPSAAFAIEPVKEGGKAFVGWWALGGVGVLAAGYGVWEWRREMVGAIRKVVAFFISSK